MHQRMNAKLNVLQAQSSNSRILGMVTSNMFPHLQTEIAAKNEWQLQCLGWALLADFQLD